MNNRERYRQIAQIHIANINQGFLATLGIRFVSLMYEAIDEAQNCVLLVEERDEIVVGFISGGSGMGTIYMRMLHHPVRLAIALIPSFFYPRRLLRIIEIIRYSRSQSWGHSLPDAELLSIAVQPAYRGQNVADRLFRRLEDHYKELGIFSFKIVVGESLLPAHRFYKRMGAMPTAEIAVHRGEVSVVYVHQSGYS